MRKFGLGLLGLGALTTAPFATSSSSTPHVIIVGDELSSISAALKAADSGAKVTIVRSSAKNSLFGGLVSRSGQTHLDRDFTFQKSGFGMSHGYYEKIISKAGVSKIGGISSVSVDPQKLNSTIKVLFADRNINIISGTNVQVVLNSSRDRTLGLNLIDKSGARYLPGTNFIDTTPHGELFRQTGAKSLGHLSGYEFSSELKGAGLLGISPIPSIGGLTTSDLDRLDYNVRMRAVRSSSIDPILRSELSNDIAEFRRLGVVPHRSLKFSATLGRHIGWDFINWVKKSPKYSNFVNRYSPSTLEGAPLQVAGFNVSSPKNNIFNFNGFMFRADTVQTALSFDRGAPPTKDMYTMSKAFQEYLRERTGKNATVTLHPEVYTRESVHFAAKRTIGISDVVNQHASEKTFYTFSYQNDMRGQRIELLHLQGYKPNLQLDTDLGISAEIKNLMGASKAIGATPAAQGIWRIEQNLSAIGEMAGFRSAMAYKYGGDVSAVPNSLVLNAMEESGFRVRRGLSKILFSTSVLNQDQAILSKTFLQQNSPIVSTSKFIATRAAINTPIDTFVLSSLPEPIGGLGGAGALFSLLRRRKRAKLQNITGEIERSTGASDIPTNYDPIPKDFNPIISKPILDPPKSANEVIIDANEITQATQPSYVRRAKKIRPLEEVQRAQEEVAARKATSKSIIERRANARRVSRQFGVTQATTEALPIETRLGIFKAQKAKRVFEAFEGQTLPEKYSSNSAPIESTSITNSRRRRIKQQGEVRLDATPVPENPASSIVAAEQVAASIETNAAAEVQTEATKNLDTPTPPAEPPGQKEQAKAVVQEAKSQVPPSPDPKVTSETIDDAIGSATSTAEAQETAGAAKAAVSEAAAQEVKAEAAGAARAAATRAAARAETHATAEAISKTIPTADIAAGAVIGAAALLGGWALTRRDRKDTIAPRRRKGRVRAHPKWDYDFEHKAVTSSAKVAGAAAILMLSSKKGSPILRAAVAIGGATALSAATTSIKKDDPLPSILGVTTAGIGATLLGIKLASNSATKGLAGFKQTAMRRTPQAFLERATAAVQSAETNFPALKPIIKAINSIEGRAIIGGLIAFPIAHSLIAKHLRANSYKTSDHADTAIMPSWMTNQAGFSTPREFRGPLLGYQSRSDTSLNFSGQVSTYYNSNISGDM